VDRDVELRDAIQRIAVEFPSYGRPRITAELRRRGWQVNPKRVYRILRQDNLLCLRKRKFVVTTDSGHGLTIYPNLARGLVLSAIDQLWVADITYIRLELEFIYLAVVLDAFSRRVIGWALDRTLEDALTLSALGMALKQRQPKPGLVHHSDRGVQYASTDYTGLLNQHGIRISMSRTGNPYDNAKAESFIKTLKTRKSTGKNIATWPKPELPSGASSKKPTTGSDFIRRWVTSHRRSLSFPCQNPRQGSGHQHEFWKAWGNLFRWAPDRRARSDPKAAAGPPRRNEFPVGYSLAGCSPAEPTSASPTACQCPSEVFGSREILSQRYTVS